MMRNRSNSWLWSTLQILDILLERVAHDERPFAVGDQISKLRRLREQISDSVDTPVSPGRFD
jgi:hypothetical protein